MRHAKYTPLYFIKKFEAIPEDNWTVGEFNNKGKCCALGHCGAREYVRTTESDMLAKLFLESDIGYVADVNDFNLGHFGELGDTPRERILNALYLIEAVGPELKEILR